MTDPDQAPTRLRVAELPQNRPTPFELRPDAETLTALAATLGLIGLRKVWLRGQVAAAGKSDWTLSAQLGATVIQPCVVTLAPVTTRIETGVERHYLANMPDPGEAEEIEMPEDENAEPLPAVIDLADVLAEALALNLPLYPRADGAELGQAVFAEPGKKAMTDADARPFSGLAALRDKLGGEPEK